jgi:4a-hydroxytetrahydrobiopterin dehydratase
MADWPVVDGALERTFAFADFVGSMAFVNRVAELAEEANHHPDIAISWNRVTLRLATHSAGAITEKDHALADRIDGLGA